MPANKCYSTREQVLDEMLRKERGATVAEMMERCNNVLHEAGFAEVRSQNTILNDMENISNRYGITIEHLRDPLDRRTVYYRYAEPGFTIYKVELTVAEAECLRSAMGVLSRFEGLPQNSWIAELDVRMSTFIKNELSGRPVIGFDTDPKYTGYKLLRPLYDAILKRQTLTLQFELPADGRVPKADDGHIRVPKKDDGRVLVLEADVWPYYLKQSGHSWFLVAANVRNGQMDGIALDEIAKIEVCEGVAYKEAVKAELDAFLGQRVGASSSVTYREPVTVRFEADAQVRRQMEVNKLHESLHVVEELDDGWALMEMTVVYTREMLYELCKYCEGLTVISPIDLRYSVARYHADALDNYGYPVDYNVFEEILMEK